MAGFIVSFLLGFLPCLLFSYIVYLLDRYEKEPVLLLGGVFTWGAVIAAGAAFLINSVLSIGIYLFSGSDIITEVGTGSFIAPVVEESLKGLAVLIIYVIFRGEFDSILDGIVYAAVTALGFAATENVYYIFTYGYIDHGWTGLLSIAFIRVVLVGWQHPFFTAFTGIGLAISRLSRNWAIKLLAPVLGWTFAVSAHALHNTILTVTSGITSTIVGSLVDWLGWTCMFGFVICAIHRERICNINYLKDEPQLGTITEGQYRIACSAWSQTLARLKSINSNKYRKINRFYQLCGELAHKKQQYIALGEKQENVQKIASIRQELTQLASQIPAAL